MYFLTICRESTTDKISPLTIVYGVCTKMTVNLFSAKPKIKYFTASHFKEGLHFSRRLPQ